MGRKTMLKLFIMPLIQGVIITYVAKITDKWLKKYKNNYYYLKIFAIIFTTLTLLHFLGVL